MSNSWIPVVTPLDGSCVGADGYRPVLARWNGVEWVNGRNRFPTGSTLAAISARTSSDVWAVGTVPRLDSTGHEVTKPFVLHYDGVRWGRVRPRYLAAEARPQAVATGTACVFLAGNRRSEQPPFAAPMTASIDGTKWTGESPAGFGNLFGVAMDPDGTGWAVGSRIGEPLVFRRQ